MTRIRQSQTNFTAGEVSDDILGRGDLRAYENGARRLRNLFIQPTGGVRRRSGLRYVDTAAGTGRLIGFEFSAEQVSLLAVTDGQIDVYFDDALVDSVAAPWTAAQIGQLAWTQSADTLLLTHPDVPPKKLLRNESGDFALEDWSYYEENDILYQPYYKFAGPDVTLAASDEAALSVITASAPVFSADYVGTRLRLRGREVEVTSYISATQVQANVVDTLASTLPSPDWSEQAFSTMRGWPATVAFHQGRLVIGGSRDLPNRLWFSKSGDLFNFDLGEGLDDEAIEFAILSDQVNAIRGLFSGRHLQVFTSGAEWMVTGAPLTPESVQVTRQTRVGSAIARHIPPVSVDGATLFVARSGQEVREFIYTDLEQAYTATDLSLVARHMVDSPVDQEFDAGRRLLILARSDGRFAALTIYRAQEVLAWTLHETDGAVLSLAAAGNDLYMLVARGGDTTIEVLDDSVYLDCALKGESETPAATWTGLDHLEGRRVQALMDGVPTVTPLTVTGGEVTLPVAASEVQIGLPFSHEIEPLPPVIGDGSLGRRLRLVEAIFRLKDTQLFTLDLGDGLKDIPLDNVTAGTAPGAFSGDARVRSLGWARDGNKPLWRIEQDTPLGFTLLSVTTELKVND